MYIISAIEQEKLLKHLVLVEKRDGGWSAIYKDPTTNTRWFLFRHHSEMHGGGLPILREDPPPPTLQDWLTMCFSSGRDDDIRGLGWELSKDFERWPIILDWLETNKTILSSEQISLFFKCLEIFHIMNRRAIVGKSSHKIDEDYQFFKQLTERARHISPAT